MHYMYWMCHSLMKPYSVVAEIVQGLCHADKILLEDCYGAVVSLHSVCYGATVSLQSMSRRHSRLHE